MASDQIIAQAFQSLVRAVDVNNKLMAEQNRILRELVEATQLANDTPLRALEEMLADVPVGDDSLPDDAEGLEPWRKVSELATPSRRATADDADELPESERWRLGE